MESNEKKRPLRVADLIKEEISKMIIKGLKDPRVQDVNITHAKVTDDLRHARIYFRVMKETFDLDEVLKGLSRAKSFIRRKLGKLLGMKFVPDLQFFYDDSIEYGEKIEKIFKKIRSVETEE